jgi:hypothetical protein
MKFKKHIKYGKKKTKKPMKKKKTKKKKHSFGLKKKTMKKKYKKKKKKKQQQQQQQEQSTEVRYGEERRHVGVVHQVVVPQAVHLVGIDRTVRLVLHNRVFLQSENWEERVSEWKVIKKTS